MTCLILTIFAAVAVIGWIAKRRSERRVNELRSIEQAAYARSSAEWNAYIDLLYALNPALGPRAQVEAEQGAQVQA